MQINFSRPARINFVVGGVLLLSLLASVASADQAPKKRRRSSPIKISRAQIINAEEMQGLIKRDGTRPLLVNFWATWCIPCREEFPDFIKIDRQYRARGLDFIAISLDDVKDLQTEVPKFLKQMRATMPVYLLNVPDPDPAITWIDPGWTGSLPATFLYNSKGEIVFKHFGRVKTVDLRAAIESVMSEK